MRKMTLPLISLTMLMLSPVVNANTATNTSELSLTTTSYPKANMISISGTNLSAQKLTNIALPTLQISQVQTVPTVVINQTTKSNETLDVSIIDDFITSASPMARHYPPVFPTRTARHNTIERLKLLTNWIDTYAKSPNASYDVLLRAAKLNSMGRNLDLGSDYAVRSSDYIARAIKLKDTAEANFLYGMMLAEGGGFKEGEKYLNKAVQMGFMEAEQSLAQSDLLNNRRSKAVERLTKYKAQHPNDPYIDRQIAIANDASKYYIWGLPLQDK